MMFTLDLEARDNGVRTTDWRDGAMNAALAAEAAGGAAGDALLREVRVARPGSAMLNLWMDRQRVLRFLECRTTGMRSLLTGAILRESDDATCPYLAWYAATWEGVELELVLPPTAVDSLIVVAREEGPLERFCRALRGFVDRPESRCITYSAGWAPDPEMDAQIGRVTWDEIVLAPDLLTGVRDAVEGFFRHREAFASLGFPWRRGILLVGPPGTGKTMICKAAVASVPELPFLYVRDLASWNGQDAISEIFERARKLAPCILAFEDIDGFVGDDNRAVFLNEMDGFRNNDGLLILGSSNHPGRIDVALLKRPSRFDRVFHVGLPGPAERAEFCRRVLTRSQLAKRLSPSLDVERLAAKVADRSEGFTPAYLKEALIGAALERAQAGAMALDEEFGRAVRRQVEELARHLRRLKDPEALAEFCGLEPTLGFRRE